MPLLLEGGVLGAVVSVDCLGRRAFDSFTGPKREWPLVLTVASVVGVIGIALGSRGTSGRHQH